MVWSLLANRRIWTQLSLRPIFCRYTWHLNDETRHIIDARRLGLMKPTAFLINVARGALVDEAALIEALEHEQIAGAGLDVFRSGTARSGFGHLQPTERDCDTTYLRRKPMAPRGSGREQQRKMLTG